MPRNHGALLLLLIFCGVTHGADNVLVLGTATSVDASGLIDVIKVAYEEDTGVELKAMVVGSGRALQVARSGRVDLVLTHAPVAERRFIVDGYASARSPFARNTFHIVGPADDPAGIAEATDPVEAMRRIASSRSRFVSRADDSGTHRREQSLWEAANVLPGGKWYVEAGQGMAETLKMASERQAYTIADRGAWLHERNDLSLKSFIDQGPWLENVYSLVQLNPLRFPERNTLGAGRFVDWMLSDTGRKLVGSLVADGERLYDNVEDQ